MARISRFVVNSDYPMPAELSNRPTATITIPAGTTGDAYGQRAIRTTIQSGNATMFRINVTSARAAQTIAGGNGVYFTFADCAYLCSVYSNGDGTSTVEVLISLTPGISATTAAETMTFKIAPYLVP